MSGVDGYPRIEKSPCEHVEFVDYIIKKKTFSVRERLKNFVVAQ